MTAKIIKFWLIFGLVALVLWLGAITTVNAHNGLPQLEETSTQDIPLVTTETITATDTMVTTPTPSATPEPQPPTLQLFYFPLQVRQPMPVPPDLNLFCAGLPQPVGIPDNQPAGISNTISVGDGRQITDLNVQLNISHTWVGDLSVRLTHQNTGRSISLIDRPGFPQSEQGCGNDHVGAILDDQISARAENQCATAPAAISGIYIPEEPLAAFTGENMAGEWVLNVADMGNNDTGSLKNWCLVASLSESPAPPTPTPPPPALPARARVNGVTGQKQALPLDCESRVAVDWARFFGVVINEFEFLNKLPKSDNPDAGFVGNVHGAWGQIPPYPYGVHAEPVAAILRDYGLSAYAHRPLSWDDLRAEIAAGRPVYVWVIGSASFNEIPVYYRSSDGHLSIVAHYEHVVMVIGYTENNVTILDGGTAHTRSLSQFLSSWSALGNMAIIARP